MSVFDPECTSREVLEHATGRWGALVLASLADKPLRFAEVRRQVTGIGDRMLSQTLQRLHADGLVSRTEHSAIPPHVTYALTGIGAPIADRICELIDTIYQQLPAIVAHHYACTDTGSSSVAPDADAATAQAAVK
ncbi:winged helix-turn-helix transcriptional regulator [Microbacterium marinilacus]|uniref:Helix-turn-helix domain-containing protein n=2 Tax=Microbacterium marinilacus TaxID=415209 RepID=A0ABP7BEK2_9MICO|nr:helix-turn-helix domain-containing protein [Microbacterium marinilacus]